MELVKERRKSLSRAARMLKLGTGVAGSYLAYQIQRPFLDDAQQKERSEKLKRKNAKQFREELQGLRGPIMKLGQAMSMQTHALGPEWIEELSALQMQAPPMHPSLMRAQFKSAFGKYPEELFKSFDAQPFAAASLGQVHWAVTRDGDEVAVKIQYPAIREAIESDFKMLRTASLPVRVTGHLKDAVISEAERGIMEETNYLKEAQNLEHFRKHLAPLKFIRVPKVYRELSCEQVLTMSRVPGQPMLEFLKSNPPQELRNQIGEGLTHLFFFQLCRLQALHADPHPGNYLLNKDGTISMVDFGCVKYLKPEVVRCYGQFWSREWLRNERAYKEIVQVLFGTKNAETDKGVRRGMEQISKFYDQLHPLVDPPKVLDLGDPKFMDSLTQLAKVLVQNKIIAADFLFLSRTESGFCNLLHMLKAKIATLAIVREYIPLPLKKKG